MIELPTTDEPVVIVQGDCLEVLRQLPDGCVDAVVTDPPYGVGIASWDSDMPPQSILDECLRVSRGVVLWFGAATKVMGFSAYAPHPDRVMVWAPAFSLAKTSAHGAHYRWHPIAIWNASQHAGELPCDVLRHNCEGRHWWDHPGTKPVRLMQDLVQWVADKDSLILDPFGGSGTTAAACVIEGRRCLTIEREPAYCDIARRRVAEAMGTGLLAGIA